MARWLILGVVLGGCMAPPDSFYHCACTPQGPRVVINRRGPAQTVASFERMCFAACEAGPAGDAG